MPLINEKIYLNNFANNKFIEDDFLSLLLPLLFQNGIIKINEKELERKLFYYAKNPNFRELFQDICINNLPNLKTVDLADAFYRQKYFGNGIWLKQTDNDNLYLSYRNDIDLSKYEQCLSEDGRLKIKHMTQELAIRYKFEQTSKVKLNIYGVDPNCQYYLVHGKYYSHLLSYELITDGDILTTNYSYTKGTLSYYYESPRNLNEKVRLENNTVLYLKLKNATYAIKRGLCDEDICYCNVNTQILDESKLNEIVNLANSKFKKFDYVYKKRAPYVRKLILK